MFLGMGANGWRDDLIKKKKRIACDGTRVRAATRNVLGEARRGWIDRAYTTVTIHNWHLKSEFPLKHKGWIGLPIEWQRYEEQTMQGIVKWGRKMATSTGNTRSVTIGPRVFTALHRFAHFYKI